LGTSSYSPGNIAGETTILFRANNSGTTTNGTFWSETSGNNHVAAVAWKQTGTNDQFDIWVKWASSFAGTDIFVETAGQWVFDITNTGSTSQPSGSTTISPRKANYVGDRLALNLQTTEVSVNDTSSDMDFRVESNNNANMLFVDASTDRVGIGAGASPASTLHIADTTEDPYVLVDGSGANRDSGYKINAGGGVKVAIRGDLGGSLSYGNENQMTLTSGAVVFNEASADIDFRVESNGQANMLFIDGGSDTVSIAQSSGSTLGGDIRTRLYVNGAINAGALRTRGFTNPNGKVFTFPVGSNGNASFLELTCTDYLGARKTIFTCNNASGNWNVTARDVMSSGTAPTFTISGSGTAQPTITVSCNTAYSGGFLKIDQMGSIPTLA
jgi:hypothetical protein